MVDELNARLCAALTKRGMTFEWEADGRGAKVSHYFFVRKPLLLKIRISQHKSNRIEKEKNHSRISVLDIGPHAMSYAEALTEIDRLVDGADLLHG